MTRPLSVDRCLFSFSALSSVFLSRNQFRSRKNSWFIMGTADPARAVVFSLVSSRLRRMHRQHSTNMDFSCRRETICETINLVYERMQQQSMVPLHKTFACALSFEFLESNHEKVEATKSWKVKLFVEVTENIFMIFINDEYLWEIFSEKLSKGWFVQTTIKTYPLLLGAIQLRSRP